MTDRHLNRIFLAGLVTLGTLNPACRSAGPGDPSRAEAWRDAEAGCAMCIFRMPGVKDCILAVKLNGRAMLVQGSSIDDHGDAHAADGLCNTARKARVRGRVEGDAFVAERIELAH